MDSFEKTKTILEQYGQQHLLDFYDELDEVKKQMLIEEILDLNFKEILSLYEKSKVNNNINYIVTPLPHIEKEKLTEIEKLRYEKIGEEKIKNGKVAIVTMAGGQGTRLGYKGPKGTYEIKFKSGKKSLFEIMCDDIKRTNEKNGITIPWYIMVSKDNKEQTISYFEEKHYFKYPKESIKFFVQDTIPLIDVEGKIVLQDYHKIKEVSNGNGNVFKAMKQNGIVKDLKEKQIEWVSFSGIDNVLLKNIDPLFIGLTIELNMMIASKTIFKEKPMEKIAVYCKKNKKPAILDYDEIDEELSERKNERGEYLYREANMLSHLMSIDAIEYVMDRELPYHRAYKKNPIINEEGMKIVPTSPNTFKFENFIFDSFIFFDNMLLLRVDKNEEFAPIKDFTGIYTPETAKEAYIRVKGIE